ncbi:MAG: hypothetical protein M0035_18805, partial [Actinomycetota bacterium]|nr:hypothetical protein [Actinomycetota bacterium]
MMKEPNELADDRAKGGRKQLSGRARRSGTVPAVLRAFLAVALGASGLLGVLAAGAQPAGASTSGADGFTWASPVNAFTISGSSQVMTAGSCPTQNLCVAGDNLGDISTSTNPTGGTTKWSSLASIQKSGTQDVITSISCPSTSFCAAVDAGGDLHTSTNPAGGASTWNNSAQPEQIDSSSGGLTSISCPTANLCVAVDQAGNVLTSTNPTGGTTKWSSPVSIDSSASNGIDSVSCPTTTL